MSAASKKNSPLDYVLWLLVVVALAAAIWGNYEYTGSPDVKWYVRVAGVIGLCIVALGLALLTKKGKEINQLRKESVIELRKVVWPNRQETAQTTLVVVVMTFVVALMLWLMDTLLRVLMSQLIG